MSTQDAIDPPHTLHRTLSPLEVMFLTFSSLSPAMSVFIYGDGILHQAGTGTALAVLIGGAVAAVATFLYAELGAAFPHAGGVYPSLKGILGPLWAFPYITMMILVGPTQLAYAVLGFADYVRVLEPDLPQIPVAVGCLAVACFVAVQRIKTGALVTGAFLMVEAIAVIVMAVVAVLHPVRPLWEVLSNPVVLDDGLLKPLAFGGLGLAIVTGVYTTAGGNWALYFGEELKDAEHRIGPVVSWVGQLAAISIAGPLILMVLSITDLKEVLGSDAPAATFIGNTVGHGMAAVVSGALVVAIFNAVVVNMMCYARLFYATGRDGIWPAPANRLLGHLHPKMRTPIAATLVVCVCAFALMLSGEKLLLVLVSGENAIEYLMLAAAVLLGRYLGKTGKTFKAPLHPLVPGITLVVVAGFLVAEWLDEDAGRPSLILLTVLFAGSIAYYWFRMRNKEGGFQREVPQE